MINFKHRAELYKLMQNLIYPSMFGAFFVLFFQHYFRELQGTQKYSNPDFYLYILLLLYFLISYLVNESISPLKTYNILTFTADIMEVIVMFFLFTELIDIGNKNFILKDFYIIALWVPFIAIIWNVSLGTSDKTYYILSGITFILLLFMGIWFYKISWMNYAFIILAFVIFFYYLYILILED